MLNITNSTSCSVKQGYLSLPKEEVIRMNGFRRSPFAQTVRTVLERELDMSQAEYEALPADDERRMKVTAVREVIALLFDVDLTIKKDTP